MATFRDTLESLEKFGDGIFRRTTKKRWDDFEKLPTIDGADAHLSANLSTQFYPVRVLGESDDGMPLILSEEDKQSGHLHILAAPDQGKSSLIELLVRGDIKRGYSACVIDPGERGDTVIRLLKYCCKIGFDKVLYISPSRFYREVPVINPLRHTNQPYTRQVGGLMDTMRILWDSRDAQTPRIRRYLPAVLHALYAGNWTLAETKWFMARDKTTYLTVQEEILDKLDRNDPDRKYIEEAFFGNLMVWREFLSTINRLDILNDPAMRRFIGSKRPSINWNKLIKDGWLILVNLDAQSLWGPDSMEAKLIGTLIINELSATISDRFRGSLGKAGKPFYLYLDEAGQFMTPKVAEILDLKRKTPLKFAISHQRFEQITDKNILSSVRSIINKVLFYTPNVTDRKQMMQDMGYGGQLGDREVMYVLGELKKQHAAMSLGMQRPKIGRIADVHQAEVPDKLLRSYIEKLTQYEGFYPYDEIDKEIDARFSTTAPRRGGFGEEIRSRPKGAGQRSNSDSAPTLKAVSQKPERKRNFED